MYFLALSQAPPVLDIDTAICTPDTRPPASTPARQRVPNRLRGLGRVGASIVWIVTMLMVDEDECTKGSKDGCLPSTEVTRRQLFVKPNQASHHRDHMAAHALMRCSADPSSRGVRHPLPRTCQR